MMLSTHWQSAASPGHPLDRGRAWALIQLFEFSLEFRRACACVGGSGYSQRRTMKMAAAQPCDEDGRRAAVRVRDSIVTSAVAAASAAQQLHVSAESAPAESRRPGERARSRAPSRRWAWARGAVLGEYPPARDLRQEVGNCGAHEHTRARARASVQYRWVDQAVGAVG